MKKIVGMFCSVAVLLSFAGGLKRDDSVRAQLRADVEASIGTTTYTSAVAAVRAAKTGETVSLEKNITHQQNGYQDTFVFGSGEITFDLNGFAFSTKSQPGYNGIEADGDLSIIDSSTNGSGELVAEGGSTDGGKSIGINCEGNLSLIGVNIKAIGGNITNPNNLTNGGRESYGIRVRQTLSISDGSLVSALSGTAENDRSAIMVDSRNFTADMATFKTFSNGGYGLDSCFNPTLGRIVEGTDPEGTTVSNNVRIMVPRLLTLTFDTVGGSEMAPQQFYNDTLITKPADPTKNGYTFGGWYKSATYEVEWDFASSTTAANLTLYAKWIEKNYTITYHGGDVAGNLTTYNINTPAFQLLPVTENLGDRVFDGWYTEEEYTNKITVIEAALAKDLNLYAKFLRPVKINFADSTIESVTKNLSPADTFGVLPVPVKEGYTFLGWFTAQGDTGTKITETTPIGTATEITIYAKWLSKDFTITYHNGTATGNPVTYNSNTSAFQLLPVTENLGDRRFEGWYTENEFTNKITTIEGSLGKNLDLYAKYLTPIKINYANSSIASETRYVDTNATFGDLPTPVKKGYTFAGWYSKPGEGGTKITPTTVLGTEAEITIYAVWTAVAPGGDDSNDNTGLIIGITIIAILLLLIIIYVTLYILWKKKDKRPLAFLVPTFRALNKLFFTTKLNDVEKLEQDDDQKGDK